MPRRNPSPWLQGSCWFLRRHYHNSFPQSCQPLHYAFIQVITECSWEVYVSWYPETRKEDNHIADTWQTSLVYTRIPPFRWPTTHGYFFLEVKGIRPPVLTESQDRQSQNITHGYFLSLVRPSVTCTNAQYTDQNLKLELCLLSAKQLPLIQVYASK